MNFRGNAQKNRGQQALYRDVENSSLSLEEEGGTQRRGTYIFLLDVKGDSA